MLTKCLRKTGGDQTIKLRYAVSCYSGISWPGPLPLLLLLYRRGTAVPLQYLQAL